MMSGRSFFRPLLGLWFAGLTLAFGEHCHGMQMEKRVLNLYDAGGFEAQAPQLGSVAPELELTDLNGDKLLLSDYRGKTVVLIKAGYT